MRTSDMKLNVLVFMILNVMLFGCNNNKIKEESEEQVFSNDSVSTIISSDQIFKNWLRDTLPNLAIWEKTKDMNVEKKEILLGKDSLSLTLTIYYMGYVNKEEKTTGEIFNMINLLKEYNELPNKDFKISFLYQMFYYPSSVEQLKFEFIYEIKDIEILEKNVKSKFQFICGRLSGKEIEKMDKYGGREIIKTDFIWHGDSLIKKQR